MQSPTLLNIDLGSEGGGELLVAIEARHGPAFAQLAHLPRRLFALRSAWAPGLRFIGGEAQAPNVGSGSAPAQVFNLAGAGLSLEDALSSCLGEGVERISQIECPGDIAARLPIAGADDRLTAASRRLIETLAIAPATVADWVDAADLASGQEILVPADWCLRRSTAGPLTLPDTPLSTGAAAGPTPEAAAARALLELIERDAAALWWIGGQRGRPFAIEDPAMTAAADLLAQLRQGETERLSWYLDLTTDLGIPCIAALSVSPAGDQLACGLAARLSATEAVRAATFEMCQMELGLQLVELKRRQRGDAALNDVDRRHLARATNINAETCILLQPCGMPRRATAPAPAADEAALAILQNALTAASIEAALVEFTRPAYAIPVMVAIAPDLQRLPCGVRVPRLTDTIDRTGGGAPSTGSAPLL